MIIFTILDKDATAPTRKFSDDAGIDIYSLYDIRLLARSYHIAHTGIGIKVPKGYVGLMKPKSRDRWLVGSGVIDTSYVGELLIELVNPYDRVFTIPKEYPIAQMLILSGLMEPLQEISIVEWEKIKTDRGATGGIVGNSKAVSANG